MKPQSNCFGVSQFTTKPWSFERDVREYAQLGVEAIEIVESKLDPERLSEQLAMVTAHRMFVASVQARIHGLFPTKLMPEPMNPADRVRALRGSIEKLAPYLPPGTPFVTITGASPDGDVARVLRTAREAYGELARVAEAHGMRLALEPLNPTLMNVDAVLWSLGDALALVEEVGHHALGLCVDSWNVWQSPNLHETIERAGDWVFLAQISDWRAPRGFYDRLIPGTGEIPLGGFIAALERAGYAGPYVVEIFSSESLPDSLWRGDLREVIRRSMEAFERLRGAVCSLRSHCSPS